MQSNLTQYTRDFAAGSIWQQPVNGKKFLLFKASGSVDVEFFDKDGHKIGSAENVEQGVVASFPVTIGRVDIASGHFDQLISFIVSDEAFELGKIAQTVNARAIVPGDMYSSTTIFDTVVTQICGISSSRTAVTVRLPNNAPGPIWLSNNSDETQTALQLNPGEKVTIQYSGELWAYKTAPGEFTVYVTEIEH